MDARIHGKTSTFHALELQCDEMNLQRRRNGSTYVMTEARYLQALFCAPIAGGYQYVVLNLRAMMVLIFKDCNGLLQLVRQCVHQDALLEIDSACDALKKDPMSHFGVT